MVNHKKARTPDADAPVDIVTEDDFTNVWNPSGAHRAWLRVGQIVARTPDFPLQPSEDQPGALAGDLGTALHRVQHDAKVGLRLTVSEIILERIVQNRQIQ